MCFFLVLFLYKEKVRRHIFHFMKNMPLLYINAREGVQVVGLRPTFKQQKGPLAPLCLLVHFDCILHQNDAKVVQICEIRKNEDSRVYVHKWCKMTAFRKFVTMLRRSDSRGFI